MRAHWRRRGKLIILARMKANPSSGKFESMTGLMAAHGLTAFLFCLGFASLSIPGLGEIKPSFILMAIYYWAIFRPTLMPPAMTFLLGLLTDFLSGFPPGLNALVFVTIQWFVREQRRFLRGQPYLVIWFGFAIVALTSGLILWLLYGLIRFHWSPPLQPLLAALMGIALFPAVGLVMLLVHRRLPSAGASG